MNYKYKYQKYKQKYISLFQQQKFILFENIFDKLILFCFNYNKILDNDDDYDELFSTNRYVHIKGGSSIKYHLKKNSNPNHYNITSDLDLFLICYPGDETKYINDFFIRLKDYLTDFTLSIKTLYNLHIISINGYDMIDISIYNTNYSRLDDDTSMFYYALQQLGIKSYSDYFEYIEENNKYNLLENEINLENRTLTTLEFEKYACIKGIENQLEYINQFDNWNIKKNYYQKKLQNMTKNIFSGRYTEKDILTTDKLYKQFYKQTRPEYKNNIIYKYKNYQKKICLIKSIL